MFRVARTQHVLAVDELYAQYQERGVRFNQRIADKPWGLREFGVETPEGHRIMFGQAIEA